jgi:hypothetical protein
MDGYLVPKIFTTKIARIVAAAALAVVLYAVAGFIIAPKIVRSALLEDIPQTLGVKAAVGDIHINPFLLQAEIKDFALFGDGGKLLGFERLFIDFEFSSLWRRAYSFANIDIAAPYVNATVGRDGTLNLLKLRPKSKPLQTRAAHGTLPPVRVDSLKITRGSADYVDHSRPTEFATHFEPIDFELRNFTTRQDGGLFTLKGSSKLGERVDWHGHLSVQPLESDGEVRIDGLRARTIWTYLEDRFNFVIASGSIDLDARYKFSLRDDVDLKVEVSKVEMTDLALRPKDSESDWIGIPAMTLSGASLDLARRQAQVNALSMTGLKVATWLEPDGSFNLLKLAVPPPSAPNVPAAPSAPPDDRAPGAARATPAAASPSWQFELRQFDLREARISAEDRGTHPTAKVELAPLSLQIRGASLDLTKPLTIALDTHINGAGSLNVSGEVTPQPMAASLNLKLAAIDLAAIQPYVAQHAALTLQSGLLGGEAQLRYGASKRKPALEFAGNIRVDKLHTLDNDLQDDFINWERLDVLGLNYRRAPDRLAITEIVATKPYARVIIESDSTLNVKRVLTGPGSAAATPAAPAPSADNAVAIKTAATKTAAVKPAAERASAPATMPVSIKKITVQGGLANFTDLSVTPNFSAGIQNLQGTVLGLSSLPDSRGKVDLHGEVDAFSPVTIKGEINVLSAALYTDVAMSFRNIDLSIFNPYSGRFAGYNITKGKLTTEMHYKVEGRKLDAQHHIVIDQLEFGAKTTSKEAVSLPIKLAVALLKDRNGLIDLNLPVGGSLDDPNFRLAPLIWKIFVNILEKVVTAPFALLGRLFGGGPELQFIDFRPGASELEAAAADKIKTLAKAMKERPQLKIELPIAVAPDIDRPALVAAKFAAQLGEIQAPKAGRKGTGAAGAVSPAFDQLNPAAKLELLAQLYARDVGVEPKYPEAVTSLKQAADVVSAKIDFLTSEIREHVIVGDAELKALGEQRATTMQQTLLADPQIDPERVFLVANDKAVGKDGMVRLELSLK